MDIVVALIGLAIVVAVAVFVAQPLVVRSRMKAAAAESPRDKLLVERDALYTTIRDLDFDFQTGKLLEADYRAIREKYTARGVEILKQLDAPGATSDRKLSPGGHLRRAAGRGQPVTASDEIEAAVQARRKTRSQVARLNADEDEIEAAIRARRKSSHLPSAVRHEQCPSCGHPFDSTDRFCAKCGAALTVEATR